MVPQKNLDLIQEDARRMQKLARDLEVAESTRDAQRIRREMVKISKEIEEASRVADDIDRAMRAAG